MSENGEVILDMMRDSSALHNLDNHMRKIIDNTIGAWLDDFEDKDFNSQLFLTSATGKYLDLHGKDYGIKRKIDESDDDYRQRIIYESLGHVTVNFLLDVYNVNLYVFIDDFDVTSNTLTSDNPYISHDGFLAVADKTTRDILNKKFVLNTNVTWVVL